MRRVTRSSTARKPAVVLALALALPAAACNRVVLDERFHDRRLANWTVIDEADIVEGPSRWLVEDDGWVHQRSNIWGRRGDYLGRWYGTLLVAGDLSWADYTLSLKAKPGDNDGFGVVFRLSDSQHFYRLLFIESEMNGGPLTRLDKRAGPDYTELWSSRRGYKVGSEMLIIIDVAGERIGAKVDREVLFELSDSAYRSGRVGLFCYAQNGQAFDDVRVTLK